jgi:hypothetical protein
MISKRDKVELRRAFKLVAERIAMLLTAAVGGACAWFVCVLVWA